MLHKAQLPNNFPIDLFPQGKGLKINGREVTFTGYSLKQVEEILNTVWRKADPERGNNVNIKQIKDADRKALSTERVAELQSSTGTSLNLSEFKVYRILTANTRIDRDRDKFTKSFLDKIAGLTKEHNPAFLFMHSPDSIIGKVFHSEVIDMPGYIGDFALAEYVAVNPNYTQPGQPNVKIWEAIENGTLEFVSIGFRARGEIKEVADGYIRLFDWTNSKSEDLFEPIHPETSLVHFGAQPNARVRKLNGSTEEEFSTDLFKLKQIIHEMATIKLNGKEYELKAVTEGDTVTVKGVNEVAIAADALSTEIASLKAENEALKKAVDGIKNPVVNNILNLSGEKGLKKSAAFTEDELKGFTTERLTAIEKDLQDEYNKAFPAGQFSKLPAGKKKEVETETETEKTFNSPEFFK